MYVVVHQIPYESTEMLGASESESATHAFLKEIVDKEDIDYQRKDFVWEMLEQWREENPLPVCPYQKPHFDQSRANDKEYVKWRTDGPLQKWKDDVDRWTEEVSIPYTNLLTTKMEEFTTLAQRQNFTPCPDYKHDYAVIFVKTI